MSQTAEKFQQLVQDEGPIGEALSLVVPLGQEVMRHTASGKYGDAELVVNKLRQLVSERKNFPKLNAVEFHMLTVMSETAALEYDIAAGNFSIISVTETPNLSFKDPYKDLPASLIPPLNFIFSFLVTEPLSVLTPLVSSLISFNVTKSENGSDLKSLLSFSGITLSISKLVLVN